MPDELVTDNVPLSPAATQSVWTSPTLQAPTWTRHRALWLTQLAVHAAPQVDEAAFEWNYGPQLAPAETTGAIGQSLVAQLDLIGQFVKVELTGADGQLLRRWYGVIEREVNDVLGFSRSGELALGGPSPAGRQTFHAFGLLRLLERVFFRSATKFSDPLETTPITIARGIPFNMSEFGEYGETGNRSVATSDGVYLFSDAPALQESWTAYTAAEYLLAHHPPCDKYGAPLITWKLSGASAILDWYVIHERSDGRSVKDLLDALIPRKRAVGYWLEYFEESEIAFLNLFSLNDSDLILPTGTIPANPAQKSLDFETAIALERVTLTNVITTSYHEIVAQGDFRTTTCTLRMNPQAGAIAAGWSGGLQADYLAGASDEDDYDALPLLEKYRRNSLIRAADPFLPVFRRFQLADDWDQLCETLFQNADGRQWLFAPAPDEVTGSLSVDEWTPGTVGENFWISNAIIMKTLALRQGLDYSEVRIATGEFADWDDTDLQALDTAQHLRPLFFTRTETGRYLPLENLALGSAFEDVRRSWSIEPVILPRGPVFDLVVKGGVPQFLAANAFSGEAATDPSEDPDKNAGLNYSDFYCTLTIVLDTRAEIAAPAREVLPGEQKRVLYIDVPDARLDYVVPYTVVGLADYEVIQTTTGGVIRDDRPRLRQVAFSAAAWYGRVRQAIQARSAKMLPYVELGDLITELPSAYEPEPVNTAVTSLLFSFADAHRPFVAFETTFAEFDFI